MKDLYDFIKSLDMHTIVVVGIACWWLNSSMNDQFKEVRTEIGNIKSELTAVKSEIIVIKLKLLQL
jgi:hypothetical protein